MQNLLSAQLVLPPTDLVAGASDRLKLRAQANGAGSRDDLKRVAGEFESMFVAYLLKVMRETIEESGLTEGGLGKEIYTELFDQELSRGIAQHGMLGISEMLMKRLSAQSVDQGEGVAVPPPASQPVHPSEPISQGAIPEIPDFQMPLQAPVISSRFGLRKDPFTHLPRFHKGLDIAAPAGTEVRPAMGGEVVYAGHRPGYGNTVILEHGSGVQTRYAHLGSVDVKKGDIVAVERVLGSVGNTGHSTGPHLHFEITRSGERVDPLASLAD